MEISNSKVIGEVLRIVRKGNDYTKKQAASYAQVSCSYLYDVENGNKNIFLNY